MCRACRGERAVYDEIRWDNTRKVIEQHEPPALDLDDEDDEALELGNSLLRALAAASDGAIQEIHPGVWLDSGSGPGWSR